MKLRTKQIDENTWHLYAAGKHRVTIERDPSFGYSQWAIQIEASPNLAILYHTRFSSLKGAKMIAEHLWRINRQSDILNRVTALETWTERIRNDKEK